MSDHDSFEDRLRAIADEVSRSMQRFSEVDMDELAERYGVDADRARSFADAAGRWLNEHLAVGDPLFGHVPHGDEDSAPPPSGADPIGAPEARRQQPDSGPGPHPLDLPTDHQGVALSALDSGRWTVQPGSNQLAGTDPAAGPAPSDVVGELRARDWITADGVLTLVGRHALSRWCRADDEQLPPTSATPPV